MMKTQKIFQIVTCLFAINALMIQSVVAQQDKKKTDSQPAVIKDRYEPNNNSEQAKAVPLNTRIDFKIAPIKDIDWFELDIPAAGYIRAIVDKSNAKHIDNYLYFYDQNQNQIGMNEARVQPGKVFAMIYDYRHDEVTDQAINVTFEFWKETDSSEVNDKISESRSVTSTDTVDFCLMPIGDVDSFKINIQETGYLMVDIDKSAANHLDPVIELYDSKFRKISNNQGRVLPGDVYVRIYDYRNDESSKEGIKASFSFAAESDSSEPNFSLSRARKVNPNEEVSFSLMPVGDVDFFELDIQESGYLRVLVDKSAANYLDPEVAIYDQWHQYIGSNEARVSQGPVYVSIKDYRNDESSTEALSAKFEFHAETDDSEVNDTFSQARNITLNQSCDFALMPRGDRDCFRIEIPARGSVRVRCDNSKANNCSPVIEIYDANHQKIGGHEATVMPGPAFVVISEYRNDGSAFESLSATVEFFAQDEPSEPNDYFLSARTVELEKPNRFALMPIGDADFFQVEIGKPGILSVVVDKTEADFLDPIITLFDQRHRNIGSNNVLVLPGTYFVKINDYRNDESSPKKIQTTFSLAAVEDKDPRIQMLTNNSPAKPGDKSSLKLTKESPKVTFQVDIASPGSLQVNHAWSVEGIPAPKIEIYDESLFKIGAATAPATAGKCYVVVALNPASIKSELQGSIEFKLTQGNDSSEPNNCFATARSVDPGQKKKFTLFPVGDRDFFRCRITEPGYLQVSVDLEQAKPMEPWIAIYDENFRQLGKHNARVEAGDVFVWIGDSYDDEASEKEITAQFDFYPESDSSEPNLNPPEARKVNVNELIEFKLMPVGDRDCFMLDLPTAGYLQAVVDAKEANNLEPWVVIYNQHFQKLGDKAARVSGGKNYVLIGDGYDDESSPKTLQARFVFIADPDLSEPNNTATRARSCECGQPFNLFLLPDKDVDFIKVPIEEPGSIYVHVDSSPVPGMKLETKIFNRHLETVGDRSAHFKKGDEAFVSIRNLVAGQLSDQPLPCTIVFLPDRPLVKQIKRPGDSMGATLSRQGDVTTSPFQLEDACYLDVTTMFAPEELGEAVVTIVGPRGQIVKPEGPKLHLPGIYHVIVHAAKGKSETPFAVQVEAVEPIDVYEPNDTSATATQVTVPFHGWVCLHATPHEDHFQFAIDQAGLFQIRIQHPNSAPKPKMLVWPQGYPDRSSRIPAIAHLGSTYSTLYVRLEKGDYHAMISGKNTGPGNADPVKLSIEPLNQGTLPPGDLKIMAFGLPKESGDYRTLSHLSTMIRSKVSTGESAADIAKELSESVNPVVSTQKADTEDEIDSLSRRESSWGTILVVLLLVVASAAGLAFFKFRS